MSFRRYIAGTVREALDRVRRELGDDAVILSNKRLGAGRIEIVAAASDSMQALVEDADRPRASPRAAAGGRDPRADGQAQPESFQDFVRRQAPPAGRARPDAAEAPPRARAPVRAEPLSPRAGVAMYHEVASVHAEPDMAPLGPSGAATAPVAPASAPAVFRQRPVHEAAAAPPVAPPAPAQRLAPTPQAAAAMAAPVTRRPAPPELPASATIAGVASAAPLSASAMRPPEPPGTPEAIATVQPPPTPKPRPAMAQPPAPVATAAATPPPAERDDSRVMDELRSLRAALSDRIAALESNIASRGPSAQAAAVPQRSAATTRVMTRLLMSGFSPDLARRVAVHVPDTSDIAATDAWLHEVIAGNLRCASAADGLTEGHGAIALMGPTGVGKTTTVAKLAARFAVRYGAAQLGLVTLDSYRIGAHEQLRSYGRILGIPMHIAQDGATLRELLASLQGKRLVLIDTCGLSQRDERMEEMLGTLSTGRFNMQPIRRVLLLNAASHAETLDEVARAWHAPDAAGAILTKLDEAARIGGAVDCLLRYRLSLFGLTNGQRVPEDWHPAGARLIAHVALKPSSSPYTLEDDEALAWSEQPQGKEHA
ncbi:MAG TPA: flagellar biosynthesis protein FlhF [Burkholderiaceae bacterium]|nr:flagellar biosynthesis protein FlhF [Burkholderiaceae bacterium]